MSDYIKREDAIRAVKEITIYGGDGSIVSDNGVEKYHNRALKMVGTELENIPSADVVERKRGEWIGEADGYADGELVYDMWYCSNCDYRIDDDEKPTMNFCPHCGADMRGSDK